MCHFIGRKKMIYVVSYDITCDRTRRKIAKLLEGYGIRIQYSVFECQLTEKRFKKLYREIFEIMEKDNEGSVRFYSLCKKCECKTVTIGKTLGELELLKEDVIVI